MFESHEKLQGEIRRLLGALRELGEGRYACLLEPKAVLLEDTDPDGPPAWPLRQFVDRHKARLFSIPAELHSDTGLEDDVFEDWEDDGFFLAFVNGRVGVLVACPDPAALEAESGRLMKIMVDRMVRYNQAWRADEKGRGLFFSRPRLDTVVVPRPEPEA